MRRRAAGSPVPIDRRTLLRAGGLAAAGALLSSCDVVDSFVSANVVRIAVSWSDSELAAFQKVLDDFRVHHGYEVDVIPLGDDIAQAVTAQANGRPDVVMLPRPGLIKPNLDVLAPLPDTAWQADSLSPEWQELVWDNGSPYGLPFKVANQSALWYRKDLFDELRLAPPGTWSEWLDVNNRLLDAGFTPLSLGGGDGWPLTTFFSNVLRGCQAADDYHDFAQSPPDAGVWQLPAFQQALRLLGGMLSVDGVLSGGVQRSLTQQYPDSIVDVFGYRNAAMVVSADFAAPVIQQFRQPPAQVGVVPFPKVDGLRTAAIGDEDLLIGTLPSGPRPLVIGADIAVLLQPPTQGARDFVTWLGGPRTPEPWITDHGGFIPANKQTPVAHYGEQVRSLVTAFRDTDSFVFSLTDADGAIGGSGALFAVLEDFLRTVGDGGTGRVRDAAATAADRMTKIGTGSGH